MKHIVILVWSPLTGGSSDKGYDLIIKNAEVFNVQTKTVEHDRTIGVPRQNRVGDRREVERSAHVQELS